ncbi:MAG: crossover junction endodeoxyribonuclease RuvC [Deltaproteobacteria bacterium]|nr:crossover junction endodeoxyribonuclease RuvC [Deltaproteobacteria bacterium]
MIAFGIDPGSRRTGWGVVRAEGSALRCVGHGVIAAGADRPLGERLEVIFSGLVEALDTHRPDVIFLESIFHHKNAASALVLGQARGVALLAARMKSANLDEIAPTEVKKAVTGRGRADKTQVKEMVRILLGLPSPPATDAADALAIAIAGAVRVRWQDRAGKP